MNDSNTHPVGSRVRYSARGRKIHPTANQSAVGIVTGHEGATVLPLPGSEQVIRVQFPGKPAYAGANGTFERVS